MPMLLLRRATMTGSANLQLTYNLAFYVTNQELCHSDSNDSKQALLRLLDAKIVVDRA
jgi:hypothetical protein